MPYSHLALKERCVIYHFILYGLSLREIGRRLNRHHTTISREIKRTGRLPPIMLSTGTERPKTLPMSVNANRAIYRGHRGHTERA